MCQNTAHQFIMRQDLKIIVTMIAFASLICCLDKSDQPSQCIDRSNCVGEKVDLGFLPVPSVLAQHSMLTHWCH